jgi:hypothetical protein
MKERPILFSAPMARAILAGSKTQTRRVVQYVNYWHIDRHISDWHLSMPPILADGVATFELQSDVDDTRNVAVRCPYGQPGDLLWVRETWAVRKLQAGYWVEYKADSKNARAPEEVDAFALFTVGTWRPSIFMPRWASRLTLRITEVRVERVQDISETDAMDEGVDYRRDFGESYRDAFAALWDDINAKRGYGWDVNPWVWVISFEVVQ